MTEHTPLPWEYRPYKHDDWGFIRGPKDDVTMPRPIAAIARGESELSHDEHRTAGTDPYAANAALIVEAVNSHAAMKARIAHLESLVEGWRSSLETISDPLLIKVDGIGTDRLLKLVNRMASIAKDALVQHPSTERPGEVG